MMPSIVDVALSQVGVREATGKNDGIPAERYNHGDKLPWCAAFVIWCSDHSDEPHFAETDKDRWEMRSVQTFEDRTKERGQWSPPDSVPRPGDVVFFSSRGGSDAGKGRHIGIVVRVENTLDGGIVLYTVEGNYGDAVAEVTHNLRDAKVRARITGYARA